MRIKNNILINSVLGVYFFILPIVLSVHVGLHSFEVTQKKEIQYDIDEIAETSYCHICNLYFDQQLYFERITIISFSDISFYIQNDIKTLFLTTSIAQLYLRGPPLS